METKVFAINDCDWYMATTAGEAIAQAMRDSGLSREEVLNGGDAYELTDEDLSKMMFTDDRGERRTFASELQRRIDANDIGPQMFASTEW